MRLFSLNGVLGGALCAVVLSSCGLMEDDANECTVGKTEACACVGGGTSSQVCLEDGTWGGCACACTTASDCASGEVCSGGRCKEDPDRAAENDGDGSSDDDVGAVAGGGGSGGSGSVGETGGSSDGVERKSCEFDAGCALEQRCRDNYCTTLFSCSEDSDCVSRACYRSAGYCFPKDE